MGSTGIRKRTECLLDLSLFNALLQAFRSKSLKLAGFNFNTALFLRFCDPVGAEFRPRGGDGIRGGIGMTGLLVFSGRRILAIGGATDRSGLICMTVALSLCGGFGLPMTNGRMGACSVTGVGGR